MKVISDIGKIRPSARSSLAIGIFDGVHCGHAFLIRQAVRTAKASGGRSVVITFFPHPQKILHPNSGLQYLLPLEERLRRICDAGVDICLVVEFTNKFSRLSPMEFLKRYVDGPFRPRDIFIGRNFKFGRGRQGSVPFLVKIGQKFGFRVHAVAPVKIRGRVVSSSLIRKLIQGDQIALAGKLLGRPVSVFGKVVQGDGRGKTLGFPTANIRVVDQIIPPRGVYATRVVIGGKIFSAMTNIGTRPTFHHQKTLTVEVHIFRLHRNLYGRKLEIRFCKKIRNEMKFSSADALVSQLHNDKRAVLKSLSHR